MRSAARKSSPRGRKSRKTPAVVLVATLIIVVSFVYLFYDYASVKIVMDWRAKLAILDERGGRHENLTIPTGIGVQGGIWANHTLDVYGPQGFAPLSTRGSPASDGTATIYIQSTQVQPFFLGDFFDIWGQPYTRSCVLDYCANADNPPPFVSNGDFEYCLDNPVVLLRDGRTWLIIIGSALLADACAPPA